jgi:integrase/recombinase XerD
MMYFAEFMADLQLRGITRPKIYGCYVGEFCRILNGKHPGQIDRADLRAFLQELRDRDLTLRSQRRAFSCVSQFCDYLVEENVILANPVLPFSKRYLRAYKDDAGTEPRQLISIDQATTLVNSILSSRDRAMMVLMFKTGMRRGEMVSLDVEDIDLPDMSLVLKPTPKRSNRLLFYDLETVGVLRAWLNVRSNWRKADRALFPSSKSERIAPKQVDSLVKIYAQRVGLHDPAAKSVQRRFTPHCCRHWFTTHLLRTDMRRDHVKWLRGDAMQEAIDIYNHIDPEDVRKSYLAHVPQLGV